MNETPYRGWRFLYPDLDAPEEFAGLGYSERGGVALVEGRDAVRQAIFLLLSTVPGERVMRPEYGCHLHRLVFAPNDDTTAGLAIYYVRRALERWEPRIEILRIDAGRSPQAPERLDVLLEYRLRAQQTVDTLAFSLSLADEES